MEIYDSPYYNINKNLLKLCGIWPYDTSIKKILIKTFFMSLALFTSLPSFNGVYSNIKVDFEKVIQNLSVLFYITAVTIKQSFYIKAEDELKGIYINIADNWKRLQDKNERKIIISYANQGRILTIGYLVYMLVAVFFVILYPMTQIFLDTIVPLNQSREITTIMMGEYFGLDVKKYYTKIYVYEMLFSVVSVLSYCSIDTTYVACVEHCLALFSIVKFRLRQSFDENFRDGQDLYDFLVKTVKLHKDCIRFSNTLESSYSLVFLCTVSLNMLNCSISSVAIIISDNITYCVRFAFFLIGLYAHLFYVSWPGQKLIDHSGNIFQDTYMNRWYACSIKSQKLLKCMALRCVRPCQITAGKIYVMNFANFAMIFKTSLSYITVLTSTRSQ